MSKHAWEYGDDEVARATLERLIQRANLSEIDTEILLLRYGSGLLYEDIAKLIGEKYFGRTAENPLWERSIRYRLNKAVLSLRQLADVRDLNGEDVPESSQEVEE